MPSLCRVTVQNGHHSNEVALNHVLLSNTQIAAFISSIIIILFLVTLYYPNCDTVIFNHEGNILLVKNLDLVLFHCNLSL